MSREPWDVSEKLKSFLLYPRWRKRHRDQESQIAFFLVAGIVGILGGLGAVMFKELSNAVQGLLIGVQPDFIEATMRLPWYMKLIVPTVGGLLAGLALFLLPKDGKGHGIAEITEAVNIRGGVLSFRVAIVRSLSSLMSIGTGASIGREGPIVQIAAALASKVGQALKLRKENLSILVGCGVAAGLAASYNVPIAASFFVMEIIIGNFAVEIFAPLVISSVVSTLVYRQIFGFDPVYGTPHFTLITNWELIVYVVLGLLSGIAAAMFREAMKRSEHEFTRIPLPSFLKPALGGLLVGIIGIGYPHVWGNGYSSINVILNNNMSFNLLLILFWLKIAASPSVLDRVLPEGSLRPHNSSARRLADSLASLPMKLFQIMLLFPAPMRLLEWVV